MMPEDQAVLKTILVVDDDWAVLILIQAVLAQEGYATLSASNGLEALDLLKDHQADLILLDNDMPIMNGGQFVIAYRSSSYRRVPIVVMTAARSAMAVAVHIGVEGYLAKPFELDELVRVVDSHLHFVGAA